MTAPALHALTEEVIARMRDCPDSRLRTVMEAVVRHLHALVLEVGLTEKEWHQSVDFLAAVGQHCTAQRHEFILLSDILGVSSLVLARTRDSMATTAPAVLGPFYLPDMPERPLGADFTDGMPGAPAFYRGSVRNEQGEAIAGALLEIWSSDGVGLYDVQRPGPFRAQGRGSLRTDANGRYWFRSVKPADYPVPTDGPAGALLRRLGREPNRPGHLHLKVSADGYVPLVTQIFAGDSHLLADDAVFGVEPSLVARFETHDPGPAPFGGELAVAFHTVDFDLTLRRASDG